MRCSCEVLFKRQFRTVLFYRPFSRNDLTVDCFKWEWPSFFVFWILLVNHLFCWKICQFANNRIALFAICLQPKFLQIPFIDAIRRKWCNNVLCRTVDKCGVEFCTSSIESRRLALVETRVTVESAATIVAPDLICTAYTSRWSWIKKAEMVS